MKENPENRKNSMLKLTAWGQVSEDRLYLSDIRDEILKFEIYSIVVIFLSTQQTRPGSYAHSFESEFNFI